MKATLIALGALAAAALVAPGALAQDANLSGQYQCVSGCGGAGLAIVTQNGWNLNLVSDAGIPTRAWIDWRGHIWADAWQLGAIFSPDGLTIQLETESSGSGLSRNQYFEAATDTFQIRPG